MKQPTSKNDRWAIDNDELTLYNVKYGEDGTGDNAVYQCKVENQHGYIWTDVYLNVSGMARSHPDDNQFLKICVHFFFR